jgi:polyisoprenoid-binding protein YceI
MRYVPEPAQSRFTVSAFATGMLAGLGHNPTFAVGDYAGELVFDPAKPAEGSISLTVKADSLNVTNASSAKDRDEIETRMRQEVLESATHSEITYAGNITQADEIAEGWYRVVFEGNLRVHGVQSRQSIDVQLRIAEGAAEVRSSGRCTLSQAKYRIKPVTALGGMIKLKDEVTVDFDIAFVKRDT